MNGRDRIEAHIHYAAAFIGGFFGMYAIRTRFMFGSAETMNMLSLVGDLLGRDFPDFLARLGALLIFSSGVALSVIITDNRPGWRNMAAFSADAAAVIAMAFMPEDMNSIIALYPVFFATSMQWCLVARACVRPYASFIPRGSRCRLYCRDAYADERHMDRPCSYRGCLRPLFPRSQM